jgi:cellulose biosynthesis protein BcsQ
MDEFFTRYNQVKEIKENIPAYFLLNEYSERINVHKTVHKTLENHYGIPILATMVKSRAAYGETGLMGTGEFEHVDKNAKSEMGSFGKGSGRQYQRNYKDCQETTIQ